MSYRIESLDALEILDSRGNPTLQVDVTLTSGERGLAGVPAGASTGSREAVELRDGDPSRYNGRGVIAAVTSVTGELAAALCGRTWVDLAEVDRAMIELDATSNKARLGANALVGVSMATARAMARHDDVPLYQWLAPAWARPRLPVPHFNVVNGGVHAANTLDFQEFMVAPMGAPNFASALQWGSEIYAQLRKSLAARGHSTGLGDEGGFAPELSDPADVLELLTNAIDAAGYSPGPEGVMVALDPAASELWTDEGTYRVDDRRLSPAQLLARYETLVDEYPIWSIEDGFGEADRAGWKLATERLGEKVQLVGDDNFVTDAAIIRAAAADGIANAALIKVNQIGTVTETLAAITACHELGFAQMISHRSGETPDTFIADLAVACGCGQLKSGAPARGERVSKYNRLLQIEKRRRLPYGLPAR